MKNSENHMQWPESKFILKHIEQIEENLYFMLLKPSTKLIVKSWVEQSKSINDIFCSVKGFNQLTPYAKYDLISILDAILHLGLGCIKSKESYRIEHTGELYFLSEGTHNWTTPAGDQLLFNEATGAIQITYYWLYIFNPKQHSFTNLDFPFDNLMISLQSIVDMLFLLKVSNDTNRLWLENISSSEQLKRSENASKGSNNTYFRGLREKLFNWLDLNWDANSQSQGEIKKIVMSKKEMLNLFIEERTCKQWIEDYALQHQVLKLLQILKLKI
jgi:hypothetical protein